MELAYNLQGLKVLLSVTFYWQFQIYFNDLNKKKEDYNLLRLVVVWSDR